MTTKFSKLTFALLALVPTLALGQTNSVTFSARLADSGQPITGSHEFTFKFWDCGEPGVGTCAVDDPTTPSANVLWRETQTLDVRNGVVTAVLGADATTPNLFPADLFNGANRWLSVTMDGTDFTPFLSIHAVPYAFRASIAESAGPASVTPASFSGEAGGVGQVPVSTGTSFSWMTPAAASHTHGGGDITSAVANATNASQASNLSCTACVQDAEIQSVSASKVTGLPRLAVSSTGATTYFAGTCTNYSGGSVTITAPTSGTIVVRGSAWMILQHTLNTVDQFYATIGTSATDCSDVYGRYYYTIPAVAASNAYHHTATPSRAFSVSAGTFTYYLNGAMESGAEGSDRFWYARMDAEFFPN